MDKMKTDQEPNPKTPRTEDQVVVFECGIPVLNCTDVVNADFARQLETELNEARKWKECALEMKEEVEKAYCSCIRTWRCHRCLALDKFTKLSKKK